MAFGTVKSHGDHKEIKISTHDSTPVILMKITGTDLFMSFDNAVVIAALIAGAELTLAWELTIILIAVMISFPVILFCANYFAKLFDRHQIFSYLAMGFLIYIGVEILFMGYYEQRLAEEFFRSEWGIRIYALSIATVVTYMRYIYDTKANFDMFVKNKK